MKKKNLERAVLLTIIAMSLCHGVVAADDIDTSLDTIKNEEVTLDNGKTYVIKNKNGNISTKVVIADNGNTTTLHIGSDENANVTLGADNTNIGYLSATGNGSKITVDGGTLTLTKENGTGWEGSGLPIEVTAGAQVTLNNKKTIIDGPFPMSSNSSKYMFFQGINVITYDKNYTDTKSNLTVKGDLTLNAYYGDATSFNTSQDATTINRKAKAGLYILSSDVKIDGIADIVTTNIENQAIVPNTSGVTVGVLVGHNRNVNGTNSQASEVIFGKETNITAKNGQQVTGLLIDNNSGGEQDTVTFNGKATITAGGTLSGRNDHKVKTGVFGITNTGGKLTFNDSAVINVSNTSGYYIHNAMGLDLENGQNTFNGDLTVQAVGTSSLAANGPSSSLNVIGINAKNTTVTGTSANITAKSQKGYGPDGSTTIVAGIMAENSKVDFSGDVDISADNVITATAGSNVDMKTGFTGKASTADKDAVISADGTGTSIKINSAKSGVVNYTGSTAVTNEGIIEMNLTEDASVWNVTGDSSLTNLESHLNTVIDMTKAKDKFNTLTVENLTADVNNDGGLIKMDVDGSAANNADRLYITGTHTGNHLISVDSNTNNAITDAAVGTVLVSVGNEQGTFAAEKTEGDLFWTDYDLEMVDSSTEGYTNDWIIGGIERDESTATTSVSAILGANALNYHTWRAENDQLMRRMGELRANGEDEQGAWFRVHGSKISRDDNAAFENEYTSYELGYDQVTKKTADMTRYTGAALSYTDGSSSYERGSGENHSKAISFYNTDIYDSGHYLDLVFKFANMDNDFNVFDTTGNAISGEYKNNGVSLSAEYGYKNDLNAGWYIEPQAQLTLGYFGGDEYETSNGIKVEQGGIASVLGRVGFNIGKQFGDNGVVYAKANLLHEFAGDYDIDMTDSSGVSRSESASFNDTWFEYGIGAAVKTGKNNHLYFDFVKTAGGDFEKDWQWNAGMRWTF